MILASSTVEASGGNPFIGLIGILIALIVFLVLIYKGWSSYWVAPICAIIVAVFNVMSPATAINSYLGGMVDLVQSLFFIIFFGAVLGKLYDVSGAAASDLVGKGVSHEELVRGVRECVRICAPGGNFIVMLSECDDRREEVSEAFREALAEAGITGRVVSAKRSPVCWPGLLFCIISQIPPAAP